MSKDNMVITHKEARRLIHFASDGTLKVDQQEILESHLASCAECRNYADSIRKMESSLHVLLRRQWTQPPIPLSIETLLSGQNSKWPNSSILLATRIATVAVMFVVFVFSAWQFAFSKTSVDGSVPASVPSIPIPSTSTQLVSTRTQTQTCEDARYVVQADDTLASIAFRFSTSQKEVMIANNMKSENVVTGKILIIPVCNVTPTGTANTLTTTFTPILRTTTSTPGG